MMIRRDMNPKPPDCDIEGIATVSPTVPLTTPISHNEISFRLSNYLRLSGMFNKLP
jgi:hypothetical protein